MTSLVKMLQGTQEAQQLEPMLSFNPHVLLTVRDKEDEGGRNITNSTNN